MTRLITGHLMKSQGTSSGENEVRTMFKFILKVIKESLKNKQILVSTFIVPSLAMLLIGFVITTMGVTDVVKLGIVNNDQGLMNTTASAGIIQGLQGQDNLTLVYLSDDQLDNAFKNKEIDGAIVFGQTFTSDLMTKKSASLRVVAEGTDQTKGAVISSALTSAATKAAAKMQQEPARSPITVIPERYYGNGLGVREFAVASIIGLISFVLPCLLTMISVLSRKGRDSRALDAPGPAGRAIAYMCTYSLLGFVQVLTVMAYILWYIDTSFVGEAYAVALVQLLIAVAGVTIGLLIASVSKDYLQAFMMFIPAIVLQMLFGGLMVPISKFPSYVQYFSWILPYTYASEAVKNIVIRGFTIGDVSMDCVALIIIALAALALSYFGLKKGKKEVLLVAEERPAA